MSRAGGTKIFCVGFMKTGLTSLNRLMGALGYRVRGRSSKLFKAFIRGDYQLIYDDYEHFDFFTDWPQPYMYVKALERYGDRAKFILSIRDENDWYGSLVRHNAWAHPITHKSRYIYGRFYPNGFKDEHIRIYREHNASVIDYFERNGIRDQLLVLDIRDPEGIEKLSKFLGIEIPFDSFPRENVSAERSAENIGYSLRWYYNRAVQPLYAHVAPRLCPKPGAILKVIGADA